MEEDIDKLTELERKYVEKLAVIRRKIYAIRQDEMYKRGAFIADSSTAFDAYLSVCA